jgi:hypothetical protein
MPVVASIGDESPDVTIDLAACEGGAPLRIQPVLQPHERRIDVAATFIVPPASLFCREAL